VLNNEFRISFVHKIPLFTSLEQIINVNMEEKIIIETAIDNLQKHYTLKANWKHKSKCPKEIDGEFAIVINDNDLKFNLEIKRELRNYQMPQIIEMATAYKPLIIVATKIFPKIKEELRQHNISYLETNGNIYIKYKKNFLWLDTQKPLAIERENINRAFSKTGLKVIFQLLLNKDLINKPYREIARDTAVALGNINYVINGLREMNFLVQKTTGIKMLTNKPELITKWASAYGEKLKPSIKLGRFRFLKAEDFANWKKIKLQHPETCWGGEPAADILTNYLAPEELTIYTLETRNELLKNYRLIPDENGNVIVFTKFWTSTFVKNNVAPALLVYADLMQKNDTRCTETAQKIYDEFI
jgi:hypothetical protein